MFIAQLWFTRGYPKRLKAGIYDMYDDSWMFIAEKVRFLWYVMSLFRMIVPTSRGWSSPLKIQKKGQIIIMVFPHPLPIGSMGLAYMLTFGVY